jgi:hypothetical protein
MERPMWPVAPKIYCIVKDGTRGLQVGFLGKCFFLTTHTNGFGGFCGPGGSAVAGSCNFELCTVAEVDAWPWSCSPPSSSIPQEQIADTSFDRRPDNVGLRIMFEHTSYSYSTQAKGSQDPHVRAGILTELLRKYRV